jgi:A-macroglobulin TED domain
MPRLCLLLIALIPSVASAQIRPQPADEEPARDLEPPISRGLAYLARQQQPDGSFQNRDRDNPARFTGPKVALTGLSLMAFLASGNMPDTGKHGLVVRNALDYLVKSCPDDGYYGKIDASRMYGHAIATLALAEAYGTETDTRRQRQLRAALQKSVKVLLDAQNTKKDQPHAGGWRYEIASPDSDLSVTGWCALALRAAHNAGVPVPKDSADRAADYILRCYRPQRKGFAYQPGGEPSITMTGAALLNLHLLDRSSRPEVPPAAQFLLENRIDNKTEYPYYARYYSTQAAFQSGGETWTRIWRRTRTALLEDAETRQEKEGAWPQSRTANEAGQTYSTALAILTLSVPLRLLPTYQR